MLQTVDRNGSNQYNTHMELDKDQAALVRKVIAQWRRDHLITDPQGDALLASIQVRSFDWAVFARSMFALAIVSFSAANFDLLTNSRLLVLLRGSPRKTERRVR